ncbi:MAG: hypothetical protein KJ621_01255 [Proteobacteria bacterium]|nr:hypothetical protein [Pseudomonadota bacterium]MBU1742134.1 hypothetical protein [Pseudomonadota bacterium]
MDDLRAGPQYPAEKRIVLETAERAQDSIRWSDDGDRLPAGALPDPPGVYLKTVPLMMDGSRSAAPAGRRTPP